MHLTSAALAFCARHIGRKKPHAGGNQQNRATLRMGHAQTPDEPYSLPTLLIWKLDRVLPSNEAGMTHSRNSHLSWNKEKALLEQPLPVKSGLV